MEEYYKIQIGKCVRELPLVHGDKVSYYSFNMLGDAELNFEAAKELSKQLTDIDVIVTVESKAIALAQEVSKFINKPRYVVIRKSKKSYMKDEVSISGQTIISGQADYYIDGIDVEFLKNKRIAFLDDVVSTCGTIDAIYNLFKKCRLKISLFICVLCEGKITSSFQNIPVKSIGFIPLMEK